MASNPFLSFPLRIGDNTLMVRADGLADGPADGPADGLASAETGNERPSQLCNGHSDPFHFMIVPEQPTPT